MRKGGTISKILSFIIDAAIVAAIVLVAICFFRPVIVNGVSMQPNLVQQDYVFVSKKAYDVGKPKIGDVVVFRYNTGDEKELLIKRVVALPDDTLDISGGRVYVDGREQDQSFTKDGVTPGNVNSYKVPKGTVYVMGDNRKKSYDSRFIGPVKISKIYGKAVFRLFPIKKAGTLKAYGGDIK